MIEINLLPAEMKKKKRAAPKIDVSKIDLGNFSLINIALVAVGAFLAIQVILFAIGAACGMAHGSFDKKYKDILPQKQAAEKLKSQLEIMGKKVIAIDELMVKRFSWAKKLNDLNESMTPGIWLTSLEYDEKLAEKPKAVTANASKKKGATASKPAMEKVVSRYLVISGAASSMGEEGTALIGRFIHSLKSNSSFYSDFSDIELGAIKREKMEDQEIMTFTITCLFK